MVARLLLIACMALNMSACDQLRTRLSNLIAPQTPEEALKSIDTMLEAGQTKEARAKAESFAETPGDLRPYFELAVARLAAKQGDADVALQYLVRAMSKLDLTPDELMADEAFNSLHMDVHFLQVITGQTNVIQAKKITNRQVNAVEDTQIKINNQGTEVRAGDIVIKLPN